MSLEKAVPFIEYVNTWAHTIENIRDYRAFYGQSFDTKMILDLFAGWSMEYSSLIDYVWKDPIDDRNFRYRIVDFSKTSHKNFVYSVINHPLKKVLESFPKPNTLNDFVSDCQRAGVPLYWKCSFSDIIKRVMDVTGE